MIALHIGMAPPSLNHLYSSGKGGRRFISKEGAEFKKQVNLALLSKFRREMLQLGELAKSGKPLFAAYQYFLPIYTKSGKFRRMDVSNRHKALEDCIAEAGGFDDSIFVDLHVSKRNAEEGKERTVIHIWKLGARPTKQWRIDHGWNYGI